MGKKCDHELFLFFLETRTTRTSDDNLNSFDAHSPTCISPSPPMPTPFRDHPDIGCIKNIFESLRNLLTTSTLDVLRHPKETIAVSLLHDNRAHEDLDGAHVLQWDLALASGLDQTKGRAELLLRDGAGGIDLVSENQERNTLQLLDGKKGLRERKKLSLSHFSHVEKTRPLSCNRHWRVSLQHLHPTRPWTPRNARDPGYQPKRRYR